MTDWKSFAAAMGLPVFPVRIAWDEDKQKWDKVPLIKDWVQRATTDVDVFDWSGANGFGIATGRGVIGIDVDSYKDGSQALQWLQERGLNVPTRKHKTVSGGEHWFFSLPPGVTLGNRANVVMGLDIRGYGGFVAFGEGYSILDQSQCAVMPLPVAHELERHRVEREEIDTSEFQQTELSEMSKMTLDRLIADYPGFADLLGEDTEDRSKTLHQIAITLRNYGFTPGEYAHVVMNHSLDARDHVVEQGKKAGRALSRAWSSFTGQTPREVLNEMLPVGEVQEVPEIPEGVTAPTEDHWVMKGDKIAPNSHNVANVFRVYEEWAGCFAFDTFKQEAMIMKAYPGCVDANVPRPMTDMDYTQVHVNLQSQHGWNALGKQWVIDAMDLEAFRNRFEPVQDYLKSCESKPGGGLLDTWLTRFFGVRVTPENAVYVQQVGRKWLIAAVARAMQPGCQADNSLVFEGHQGIRKSTGLRTLVPDEAWFCDTLPEFNGKDASSALTGHWIIELSELTSVLNSEIEDMRRFLTRQIEKYRPAYGRLPITVPRRCVFAGTTNRDNYLKDVEGERRIWPVQATAVDVEGIKLHRDTLWGEAYRAYLSGEVWYISDQVAAYAKLMQQQRVDQDPWLDHVQTVVRSLGDEVAVVQVMAGMGLGLDKSDQRSQRRVAACLKTLGYVRDGQFRGGVLRDRTRYRKVVK